MAIKYVRKTGSDSGSSGPFLTIQYGINQLEVGDTLVVGDGVYDESSINILKSNVTIKAENKHGAKINGGWNGWKNFNGDTYAPSSQDPKATDIPAGASGAALGNWGSLVSIQGNNVTLDGFEIFGSPNRSIEVAKNSGDVLNATIKNMYVRESYESGLKLLGSQGCIIEDCVFYHCSLRGRFRDAGLANNHPVVCSLKNSGTVKFRRNLIYQSNGEGIGIGTCGKGGTIVEDNIIFAVRTGHIYWDWAGDGTGGVVQRNILATTQFNRRSGNSTTGMNFRDELQQDGVCSTSTRTRNWEVRNNLIIGFGVGLNFTNQGNIENIKIYNNTFVNCKASFNIVKPTTAGRNFGGNEIKNNIFYGVSGDSSSASAASTSGITWGANILRTSVSNTGGSNIIANPQLVNINAGFTTPFDINPNNYKLTAGSPAVDTGVVT